MNTPCLELVALTDALTAATATTDAAKVALFDARAGERRAHAALDRHKRTHGCFEIEASALSRSTTSN